MINVSFRSGSAHKLLTRYSSCGRQERGWKRGGTLKGNRSQRGSLQQLACCFQLEQRELFIKVMPGGVYYVLLLSEYLLFFLFNIFFTFQGRLVSNCSLV